MERRILFLRSWQLLATLFLICFTTNLLKAADKTDAREANPPKTPAESPAEAQQALRAYMQSQDRALLHLQEQLHQTTLNLDENRKAILGVEQSEKQSAAA